MSEVRCNGTRPELPEGWTQVDLKSVAGEEGLFVDGDWILSQDLKSGEDVRLLQLSDIGVGEFLDKSSKWISRERYEELGCTEVQAGDILISRMAEPIARACRVPDLAYTCITAVDVTICRVRDPRVDPDWVVYALNGPALRLAAEGLSSGTTRKRITRKKLGRLPLPVPALDEQRRMIALTERHLASIGTGVQTLRQCASLAERFRSSFLQCLAPSDTPMVQIDEIGDVFVGATPSRTDPSLWNGQVNWVSSGEVAFSRIAATRERISEAALGNRERRLHPPGTVLMAMIGEGKTRGQAAILEVPAAHNQNSAAIRLDPQRMVPEFLFYCLMRQYEQNRRVGSGSQQPALNAGAVAALKVPCPSIDEQRCAVAEVDAGLALARKVDAEVASQARRAEQLMRVTVAATFRGDLSRDEQTTDNASAT